VKVLFAGTPDFAVAPLLKLIQSHTLVGVFTQPDRKSGRGKKITPPPVKVIAEEHNLAIFQPNNLKDQTDVIRNLNADLMVVVAYGMLLPQEILDIPKYGCFNIHASLLPRWRGAAPIQRAIEAGDALSGVSIMKMELGLDTGPVYQTLSTEITHQDTSATLHDKLAVLGAQGIIETLSQLEHAIERGIDLEPTPQDDANANYAKKITKHEASIDWTESATQIQQRIRAFNPWPICQTQLGTTRLRLWQSSVLNSDEVDPNYRPKNSKGKPGEIVDILAESIIIACGEDFLCLEKLQRDGSKPLSSREFLNGYELQIGNIFV